MKKMLSILLVVCALLSVMSIGASAAQQVMEGNASSTISFRQPSVYCILIPEVLTADDNGWYEFDAEHINITNDEKIIVTVANADENGRILFTHEDGEHTLKKELQVMNKSGFDWILPENCVAVFEGEDLDSKVYFMLSPEEYECQKAYAGIYTATVEFNVILAW